MQIRPPLRLVSGHGHFGVPGWEIWNASYDFAMASMGMALYKQLALFQEILPICHKVIFFK